MSLEIDRLLESLPVPLRSNAKLSWRRLHEAGARPPTLATEAGRLNRVLASSAFATELLCRYPDLLSTLMATGWLSRSARPGEIAGGLREALGGVTDEPALMAGLRQYRNQELLRVLWRDVNDLAGLDETLTDLSDLAEACLREAADWLTADQARRWGTPRDGEGAAIDLIVLGMGKLGGRELNFSSDVDLIFAYPAAGATDGHRPVENERFFTRVAQRLIKVLSETTTDGFVYRVDARLRPFGESGPLVMTFNALESYYETHGREWERYALIKARPVAGDLQRGRALVEALRPFVYRRYLDYGAIEAMREMKALIREQVRRRGMEGNIKLGAGGIREIEFIGQVFQLIRGGQEKSLRIRRIQPVLERLGERGVLAPHTVQNLIDAYRLLRRVENRLQQWDDRQTHELPQDELAQVRLAYAVGAPDWPTLAEQLKRHRRLVHEEFEEVFASPQTEQGGDDIQARLAVLWSGQGTSDNDDIRLLGDLGLTDPHTALSWLRALRQGNRYASLTQTGRARLDRLIPMLLRACVVCQQPDPALRRTLQVVESIARRSPYLSLLNEHPMALSQLVRLCAASPWIADHLAAHPAALDELLDPRSLYAPPDRAGLREELSQILSERADLEGQMDALRQFHQVNLLRIAAADVSGRLPLMQVSDRLTDLAEVLLGAALTLAWEQLTQRHGSPGCVDNGQLRPARFVVIGYGKLGGLELGYGSDLDLVYLHDSTGDNQYTDGERSLDNQVFFARLVQRLPHLLATRTAAGTVYEIDTRLRPSGRAGQLVSGFSGFETYQQRDAWTWEHQALVRARPVAGPRSLRDRFDALRERVLRRRREPGRLREDVLAMRERMRRELDQSGNGRFDLKQGRGGITDIEFMVQYNVLRWAADHPQVTAYTDNIRLLGTFAAEGLISAEEGGMLADAYRALRVEAHRLSLQGEEAIVDDNRLVEAREAVDRYWRRTMACEAGC